MTQSNTDIARDLKQAMSAADFDRAARIGAKILRLHPKRTDIQIMTAVSELQGSKPARAKTRLAKLFDALPVSDRLFGPVAHNFLQYSRLSNDFSSFESAVKRRLRAAPQSDLLSFMLADVIFQKEVATSPGRCFAPKLAQSIEILSAIPRESGRYDDAQKLLARIYLHQEQHELAFAALEGCVSRTPGNLDVRMLLASSYALAGHVEKAVSTSLEIIKANPQIGAQPYVIISFMRPQSMPDGAEEYLSALLDDTKAARGERYKAAFALARIEETKGDMKTAFAFYQKGHAANRAENPFDMTRELAELKELGAIVKDGQAAGKGTVAPSEFSDSGDQSDGPKPIFIVGMPRSGTTLTERILGAHPDVHAAGEIGDFAKIVAEVVGRGQISEQLKKMDDAAARKIRKRYLEALRDYGNNKRFVTNKTPANFLRVEMLRRVFPDAPIIHTHRYPLATCLSIYTTPFAIPMRYADDLAGLAAYYRGYVELINTFFETDQNGQLYDLGYEDLVADPEAVARDYLAHCGLEWDPGCLEFYRSGSVATTASMIQVRRPIFKDSVEKWQRFEPFIGPLATLGDDAALNTIKSAQKSSRRAVAA
jgi:tetratricopeptide (TPR) repeat protein